MNRAEKRRQQKLSERAAKSQKPGQFSDDQVLQLAVKNHSAGRVNEAKAIYQRILEANPNHSGALHLLGVIGLQMGQYGIAIDLITKALTIAPNMAEAHSNLGSALEKDGRLEEAIVSFCKALSIKPDYVEAHYNLGLVLRRQGKPADAVICYGKALAIKPDYCEAHNNLGNALNDLGKFDEAVDSYRQAVMINPNHVEAYNNLGNVLRELRELDAAIASYQKALAIKPDHVEAQYNLGNVLKDLGQLEEAAASYHKALAIKPEFPEAWNNLKFVTRALQLSKVNGEDRSEEVSINGFNDLARATVSYAMHQFYLAGFRPHEADKTFATLIASFPPTAEQTILINPSGQGERRGARLPDKVVALLHFGRSGTGFLHSLIDSHPEISTLPSIYLRGYFNEGVWGKLSADGWRGLPQRFADEFAVLFDARTAKPIPSRLGESPFFDGKKEGMTSVGENRDEFLSLDREAFCSAALRLMNDMESVDPMSFLMVVHAAFDEVIGSHGEPGAKKHLCFYHIHNPDDYAKPNFLRFAPDARLVVMVRDPIQSCESWIRVSFQENNYNLIVRRILDMLFGIDQIIFRKQETVGIRLEDLIMRPEATMLAFCAWLGVEESPSLFEATAQGKKWWGDPSSPDYQEGNGMRAFDDAPIKRAVGTVFGEKDQFVLQTLFYPFSLRFGYKGSNPAEFEENLREIRPLLDELFDFETVISERLKVNPAKFKRSGDYLLLRAGLLNRWDVLNEFRDYPHMLSPLNVNAE